VEETNNSAQPVSRIEEYFYEAFADQRRSRNLGSGVFLSTVHSVKGLEFDHVFLLGEHWPELTPGAAEEERRLYYVAMTRARETLQLFAIAGNENPHPAALSGDCIVRRELRSVCDTRQPIVWHVLLGMEDLFLDFAGVRREEHPARLALMHLNVGDLLRLDIRNNHLELVNIEGLSVARLSRSARERWWRLMDTVEEVRIVAMVRRYREYISDETFRQRCFGDVWEVPLVEVRHR
jgi:ATP-dependent DNA helicase RecQ